MKKLIIYIVCISSSLFIFSDDEPYTTYTGEVLQCNFNEGKGLDDALNMVRNDWYNMEGEVDACSRWPNKPEAAAHVHVGVSLRLLCGDHCVDDCSATANWSGGKCRTGDGCLLGIAAHRYVLLPTAWVSNGVCSRQPD